MTDLYSVGTSDRCPCPAQAAFGREWGDAFGVTIEYDIQAKKFPSYRAVSETVNERDARRAWIAAMHLCDRDEHVTQDSDVDEAVEVARTLGWVK